MLCTWQMQNIELMLAQCCSSNADGGLTLHHYSINVGIICQPGVRCLESGSYLMTPET